MTRTARISAMMRIHIGHSWVEKSPDWRVFHGPLGDPFPGFLFVGHVILHEVLAHISPDNPYTDQISIQLSTFFPFDSGSLAVLVH